MIDQSGASLDRKISSFKEFQNFQKIIKLKNDQTSSSVQKFLLVFLSIVISGSNSVIKQWQSCVEVDMRLNGPRKQYRLRSTTLVDIAFFGPLNLISTSTQDYNCILCFGIRRLEYLYNSIWNIFNSLYIDLKY